MEIVKLKGALVDKEDAIILLNREIFGLEAEMLKKCKMEKIKQIEKIVDSVTVSSKTLEKYPGADKDNTADSKETLICMKKAEPSTIQTLEKTEISKIAKPEKISNKKPNHIRNLSDITTNVLTTINSNKQSSTNLAMDKSTKTLKPSIKK